jgi:hypothetical protein
MGRSSIERKLRLGVETLERRDLLSGTVKISVNDGVLKISGDSKNNCVEITKDEGVVEVQGCDGTKIKGEIGDKNVSGLSATLGKGDDELRISGVNFDDDVSIHMNEGKDLVDLKKVNVDGDLNIGTGEEDDELNIDRSSAEDVTIDGKDGENDDFDDKGGNEFDDFDCTGFETGCEGD